MPIRTSSHDAPVFVAVMVELVPVCVAASPANHEAVPEPTVALKATVNSIRFHWLRVSAVLLLVPVDVSPGNFHCITPALLGAARLPSSAPPLKKAICRMVEVGFAVMKL